MEHESLAFVMVGHIDHGKSTLIGRLLCDTDSLPAGRMEEIEAAARAAGKPVEVGFVIDHLREERERGMTIDTAQTFFSSPRRDYAIIDAPGHKEFIKNMITGASQAEAAVLLCSVADGVQEQTKRHAYVVKLLGLTQLAVAYNKMDLAGYRQDRFEHVRRDMDAFLARIGVAPTFEVPISAREGDNVARRSDRMPWYDGPTVVESLDGFRKLAAPVEKPLRFPVQDVYDFDWLRGDRVAVGRVESGRVRTGEALRFLPGGRTLVVRAVRQYLRDDLAQAQAGECIGLVLDGDGVRRGDVGCLPDDQPALSDRLRASVFWLSEEPFEPHAAGGPLLFRCATQEQPCRIAEVRERVDSSTLEHLPADRGRLEHTEVGDVLIETEAPVVVESFYDVPELGRFVLVRGRDVMAGGIVTQPRG